MGGKESNKQTTSYCIVKCYLLKGHILELLGVDMQPSLSWVGQGGSHLQDYQEVKHAMLPAPESKDLIVKTPKQMLTSNLKYCSSVLQVFSY